jgi:acyl-CoA thioester hydrolase
VSDLLAGYPVVVDIPVAWGEMDAFGHVNNTAYFRYFETARMAYFDAIGYMKTTEVTGIGPILAHTDCRFRLPLEYPDHVRVAARADQVTESGFLMHYRAVSERHGKVAAEGTGRIVSFDYRRGGKSPLQRDIVEAIARLEGGGEP